MPAAFGVAGARRDAGRSGEGLLAQGRQDRHHKRQHGEDNHGRRDDRAVVGVQSAEAHAGLSTIPGTGAGASTDRGRMDQTLSAKTTWLPTISRPPIGRQSHSRSAAITAATNDWPATQEKPWSTPAVEMATT